MAVKEKLKRHMSRTDRNRLNRATDLAKMSSCTIQHGALITIGGAVVATGINRMRNLEYNVRDEFGSISVHAEIAALRSLGGKAKGGKIYVARWMNSTQSTSLSRPCDACMEAIIKAEIKEIVYTS